MGGVGPVGWRQCRSEWQIRGGWGQRIKMHSGREGKGRECLLTRQVCGPRSFSLASKRSRRPRWLGTALPAGYMEQRQTGLLLRPE